MTFEKNQFDDHKDQRRQEHENTDPVNPMHIPHPLRIRRVGISFPDIEVFFDLSPYTHAVNLGRLTQNPIYLHSQISFPAVVRHQETKKGV